MPLDPELTYVHLAENGQGTEAPGGPAFWQLPPAEVARFDQGWLVSEFVCSEDWNNWEMHPHQLGDASAWRRVCVLTQRRCRASPRTSGRSANQKNHRSRREACTARCLAHSQGLRTKPHVLHHAWRGHSTQGYEWGLTPRSAPDPLRQAAPAAKRACLCSTSRRAHPASAVGVSSNVRRQNQVFCFRRKASAYGVHRTATKRG